MTSRPFTVRRAVPGDEPTLRQLRLEALTDAPEAFCSTYDRELARTTADWQRWISRGVTLLLEESGVARGLVAGVWDAEDPSIVHIKSMWVHPALRGAGGADALVVEHLAWARTVGARLVRLDVIATNDRARRFYERHEFRATGPPSVREGDCREQLRMERAPGS